MPTNMSGDDFVKALHKGEVDKLRSLADGLNKKTLNQPYKKLKDKTPLVYAIQTQDEEMVEILTTLPPGLIDYNQTDEEGYTPLMHIIETKNPMMCDLLLRQSSSGASLHLPIEYDTMKMAIDNGDVEILELICRKSHLRVELADPYSKGTLLHYAIAEKAEPEIITFILRYLLRSDDHDTDGDSGDRDGDVALISLNTLDQHGHTPLMCAALCKNAAAVQLICGFDYKNGRKSLLPSKSNSKEGSEKSDIETANAEVQPLLSVMCPTTGNTALHFAAAKEMDLKYFERLLTPMDPDLRFDITNQKNRDDSTYFEIEEQKQAEREQAEQEIEESKMRKREEKKAKRIKEIDRTVKESDIYALCKEWQMPGHVAEILYHKFGTMRKLLKEGEDDIRLRKLLMETKPRLSDNEMQAALDMVLYSIDEIQKEKEREKREKEDRPYRYTIREVRILRWTGVFTALGVLLALYFWLEAGAPGRDKVVTDEYKKRKENARGKYDWGIRDDSSQPRRGYEHAQFESERAGPGRRIKEEGEKRRTSRERKEKTDRR